MMTFADTFDEGLRVSERHAPPQPRFHLLTVEAIERRPTPPYRVKSVIPSEGVGSIFGPPGSAKSFLVLNLLATVSEGEPFFGHRTKQAECLYIGLEGEAGVINRVRALRVASGFRCKSLRFLLTGLDIRNEDDRAELVADIRASGFRPRMIVIDTLARAAPGADENSSQDMGSIIEGLSHLQRELGGVVIAVHHAGKDLARGLRGHSSLRGALDFAIETIRDGSRREWKIDKAKDGEDGATFGFELRVIELGVDEDGEPVTSCVVQPSEAPADIVRGTLSPGGGNQRIAYDAVVELLRKSGVFGRADAPPLRPCVTLADALDAITARLACEPKRRRERATTAITGLVGRGCLCLKDEWLWLP